MIRLFISGLKLRFYQGFLCECTTLVFVFNWVFESIQIIHTWVTQNCMSVNKTIQISAVHKQKTTSYTRKECSDGVSSLGTQKINCQAKPRHRRVRRVSDDRHTAVEVVVLRMELASWTWFCQTHQQHGQHQALTLCCQDLSDTIKIKKYTVVYNKPSTLTITIILSQSCSEDEVTYIMQIITIENTIQMLSWEWL